MYSAILFIFSFMAIVGFGTQTADAGSWAFNRWMDHSKQFEQTQVSGEIRKVSDDGIEVFSSRFVATCKSALPLYYEIAMVAENPGEPHLESKWLTTKASGYAGNVCYTFSRKYISIPEPALRESTFLLSSRPTMISDEFLAVSIALYRGIGGEEAEAWPFYRSAPTSDFSLDPNVEILAEVEFMGIPCYHIRYRDLRDTAVDGKTPALEVEVLALLDPEVWVLEVLSVTGGLEAVRIPLRDHLFNRKVVNVGTVDGHVMPTEIEVLAYKAKWIVKVDSFTPTPDDYVPSFEFNKFTGVRFIGDAEESTRNGTPRIAEKNVRSVSTIPFTNAESDAIRRFILDKTGVDPMPISLLRLMLYGLNAAAAVMITTYVYRKVRHG